MSFFHIVQSEWAEEDIQRLVELQNTDRRILAVRDQMRVYPGMLREWDTRLAQKKQMLENVIASREDHSREGQKLDQAIRTQEEKVRKYLQQQAEVKTNKEYQALTHEIDTAREEIDKLEDRMLELLTEEEEAEARVKMEEEEYRKLELEANGEKQRIENEFQSKREVFNQLKERRANIVRDIPETLLNYYEEMFEKHPGTVIVDAKNGSCGGCHMQIIPQILVDIRQASNLRTCSRCLRLLVWDIQCFEKKSNNT